MRSTPRRDDDLTPKQEEARQLLAGDQRHTCLVGGARSGKTFLLVRQTVVRALKYPESRHAILRFRGNAARSSISLDTLPKVLKRQFPGIKVEEKRQDGYFVLPNNSQIWVGGLDDKERAEKILGQEYATIFLNECSQIPYSSVVIALTRLAQQIDGLKQRAYYDLNPTGSMHWSNVIFGDKKDPVSRAPIRDPDNYLRLFMNPKDNAQNLSPEFIASLQSLPEKQRKRFYEGVYVNEIDGALWTYDILEQCRDESKTALELLPTLSRVVVAVDPSGAKDAEDKRSDEIGIVVCGLGLDGKGYVLADRTIRDGPAGWGREVAKAFKEFKGDSVVAEINFGGAMVKFVIEAAEKTIPVIVQTASRGKHVRAEPVSALYAQGKVVHVGRFPDLEDQLCNFSASGYMGERSPDRGDALVFALTELMVGKGDMVFGSIENEFLVDPIRIPSHWPQAYALVVDRDKVAAVFMAIDGQKDTVYLTDEYLVQRSALPVHAEAIRKRGRWLPGLFDPEAEGRKKDEGLVIVERLVDLQLEMFTVEMKEDAGIEEMTARLGSGRIKVFKTMSGWLANYRRYRRDADGDLVEAGDHLMKATAILMQFGKEVAVTENKIASDDAGFDLDAIRGRTATGY